MKTIDQLATAVSILTDKPYQNRYTLNFTELSPVVQISILSIDVKERLNEPWCYKIEFTNENRNLNKKNILTKPATFSFLPQMLSLQRLNNEFNEHKL